MDDSDFSKSSSKPISLVGRHCYPFFRDHLHNPYPTSQEKESIVSKANSPDVTMVSVSNWFANSRRRSGWIELCNESYNGDTKLMVEACSHVIINRGKSRDNDPPGLVDKILDMERKVRKWHESETEPDSWAVALCDLVHKYETYLRLEANNESSDIRFPADSTPTMIDDNDDSEDQKTHSVAGVKRSHKDYMLGSYAYGISPRSLSVSSISSLSSSSSECYSSEEEERPVKRGRINSKPTKDKKKYSAENLERPLRSDNLQLKRRLSATSFDEDSADLSRTCKRFRPTDFDSSEGSNELLIQVEQPSESIHTSSDTIFQPIIHGEELDVSRMPTVDLQPPDASWSLDIDLYDWSSSPDILSMLSPNARLDSHQNSVPAFMPTVTEPKIDDPDEWLRHFFMGDLSETTRTSSYLEPSPLTSVLDDTTQAAALDIKAQQRAGDLIVEPDLGHVHESSLTLLGADCISWPLLSDPGSETDPFPKDFPESFLLDFSSLPPFRITDVF